MLIKGVQETSRVYVSQRTEVVFDTDQKSKLSCFEPVMLYIKYAMLHCIILCVCMYIDGY